MSALFHPYLCGRKAAEWLINMRRIIILLVLISMISLASCQAIDNMIGGGDAEDPLPEENCSVVIDSENLVLFVGDEKQIGANAYNNESADTTAPLVWNSSDDSVATVTEGKITAISGGVCDIAVTYGDVEDKIRVDVIVETTAENVNSFDEKYINIFGRNKIDDGVLELHHTANAIETGLMGGSLSINLETDYTSYMRVYVDGVERENRITVDSTTKEYLVVSNLSEGYHVVRMVKATEMQNATWRLMSINADSFATVPEKSELKIEFVGDSITAGYGALGSRGEAWSVKNSDTTKSYSYMTAEILGADYSIVAWSGICTKAYHWSDDNMSLLYERQSYTDYTPYAFNSDVDVVVVNLGTNDASYIHTTNGGYSEQFWQDYFDFISTIRQKNPDAYIVCLYGMMGKDSIIDEGITMAIEILSDPKIIYNPIEIASNGMGANGHPSTEAHAEWAKLLAAYIKTLKF